MTKERAISLLRRYRQPELAKVKHYSFASWTMREFGEKSYTRHIVQQLIQRIKASDLDPISEVHKFYVEIDDILCHSENQITKEFCSTVQRISGDLMEYLWIEKEADERRFDMQNYIFRMLKG